MSLVIDTNIFIDIEDEVRGVVDSIRDLSQKYPGDLGITCMTFYELYYGCLEKSEKTKGEVLEKLNDYTLLNTTRQSSMILAKLKKAKKESGKNIPDMDLIIASIVIDKGWIFVTRDKHFKGIGGLKVIFL